MEFRYETHCHCSQCSACAHSSSAELVQAYHEAGFAGMVLTDHFIYGNNCVPTMLLWEDRMRCYYNAYLDAKKAAEPLDFDVIFGIEHAYGNGYEVLCYGIDLDFLLNNPDIPQLTIQEFADRVHKYGGILIQAHPYRYSCSDIWLRPDIIDGIEVYNAGNPPGTNDLARYKTKDSNMILTSGGDIHLAESFRLGSAGIILDHRVRNEKELVSALKQRRHDLIMNFRTIHGSP